ncbi:MAG TPA: diversity-generating retroelement protein Avd [Planctomycetota bacterium]|nr:diversity-generating retroelement protein Avd [Planctomycetota bacterium]
MRGAQEPIVFQHAYDLTRWYADRTAAFPKTHRFTLGDRVQTTLFDLLSVLQDAAYGKGRAEALIRAQDCMDKLRLWNRLARDLRCVSPKQYAYAAERIEEIGRQVGGWSRSSPGRGRLASSTDGTPRPVPAGRELEQQCGPLPFRVPQRQSTIEPQHEQRLPGAGAQDSREVR